MHGVGWLEEGFPRPRGDEPGIDTDVENIKAFSPPTRG